MNRTYKLSLKVNAPGQKTVHGAAMGGHLWLIEGGEAVAELRLVKRSTGKKYSFAEGKVRIEGGAWRLVGDQLSASWTHRHGRGDLSATVSAAGNLTGLQVTGHIDRKVLGRQIKATLTAAGIGRLETEAPPIFNPPDDLPAVTLTSAQRAASGPLCFVPAPQYFYASTYAQRKQTIANALRAGADGLSFELVGPFAVAEYQGKPLSGGFVDLMKPQIDAAQPAGEPAPQRRRQPARCVVSRQHAQTRIDHQNRLRQGVGEGGDCAPFIIAQGANARHGLYPRPRNGCAMGRIVASSKLVSSGSAAIRATTAATSLACMESTAGLPAIFGTSSVTVAPGLTTEAVMPNGRPSSASERVMPSSANLVDV
jgi:hypothetical protein